MPTADKQAARRGHEIASHGYAHQLIYTQTREQFRRDVQRAKSTLENIVGKLVRGYLAPGFSIMKPTAG